MLGRLFSTATGHGRSISSLESVTEEKHTRNLLFAESLLSSSPPVQLPTVGLRFGDFDDQNGLLMEEKDIRILLAQEDQERPSILFDTNTRRLRGEIPGSAPGPKGTPAIRHERTMSSAASPKSYFGSQTDAMSSSIRSPTATFPARHRAPTVSGGQFSPPISSESRDFDLLECMFGSSSVKAGTKIHIIKTTSDQTGKPPRVPSSPLASPAANITRTPSKPPLIRAQTLNLSTTHTGHGACDMIVITRTFTVATPELEKATLEASSTSSGKTVEQPNDPPEPSKPPKLREKKTPAYAVSLIIQLPREERSKPMQRQAEYRYSSPPAPSSFDSDLQSSWTFFDTLPPSLSMSRNNQQANIDGNIDLVLRRWNVIVRHLSIIEKIAKDKIYSLLSQIDDTSNGRKIPKEKKMQRINQKIIRLSPFALAEDEILRRKSLAAIQFVRTGLSIPSVQIMPGGHWLEEARMVAEKCSQKNFLVILLSAFLGNHFEWINEIGKELHEKRLLLKWKPQQDKSAMRSRTVIICEDRILARRLVFLLASFLFPGMLSLRSISGPDVHKSAAHLHTQQIFSGSDRVTNNELSTSISSAEDDRRGRYIRGNTRRGMQRNPSDTSSLKTAHLSIPRQDSSFHKSSAGTTTTVTPGPSTPLAYTTSSPPDSEGYFPAPTSASVSTSAAAASLKRLRRTSSTASTMQSTWGSLLGSIWTSRQTSASNTAITSDGPPSETTSSQRSDHQAPTNQLQNMVDEVGTPDSPLPPNRTERPFLSSEPPRQDVVPQLKVDENDGVVDVDLKLPNPFLPSYASSPDALPSFPTPLSNSTTSFDDARSFFSVGSNPKTSADHVNNIAGYLKQYHPDFVLQAVRSCNEKEIRESMTDIDTSRVSLSSSHEECNTLIADARNFSVKRLMLRRKLRSSEKESEQPQQTASEDEFTLESIFSYDETLAEAIDRALDKPSNQPSRLPSPSPSKQQRHFRTVSTSTVNAHSPLSTSFTPTSTADAPQPVPVPVPRRNRGQFIIDALKEVVGEVDRDLHSSKSVSIPTTGSNGRPSISKPQADGDNVLREGVKRWLQGADETSVW